MKKIILYWILVILILIVGSFINNLLIPNEFKYIFGYCIGIIIANILFSIER